MWSNNLYNRNWHANLLLNKSLLHWCTFDLWSTVLELVLISCVYNFNNAKDARCFSLCVFTWKSNSVKWKPVFFVMNPNKFPRMLLVCLKTIYSFLWRGLLQVLIMCLFGSRSIELNPGATSGHRLRIAVAMCHISSSLIILLNSCTCIQVSDWLEL